MVLRLTQEVSRSIGNTKKTLVPIGMNLGIKFKRVHGIELK